MESEQVRSGTSPMRACMVAYTFYESDNRVRRYAETLVQNGYRVDAIALRREKQSDQTTIVSGVRVFHIQCRVKNETSRLAYLGKLLLFFLRSMVLLTWEQIKDPYDLIHVHSVPDFEVFAALYPKLAGSKVVLDIHDIVPEFYASKFGVSPQSVVFRLLVAVERLSAAFSDHVIAANHIWHQRLRDRSVQDCKLTAILNFPDTQMFRRHGRNRSDNKFIVLYPGSLNYHQGVDIAVRAFAIVKDQAPEAEFHIYGSGEQFEYLKSLIMELKLQDRVFLRGSLPIDQMVSVMENADMGVVPKRKNSFGNEAFSTKILEFMVMGVPVILPDTDIDTHYFNDSVAKFFRADDEQSLAAAMAQLMKDLKLREDLVKNASEFVKQYSWNANQAVYLDLVDSLVNSKNGRAKRRNTSGSQDGRSQNGLDAVNGESKNY
jgi:glycosyltransferase involved in cell wall biosynthesis